MVSEYHASHNSKQLDLPGINTILPLLRAPIHTIDTQYHCMNIIKNNIEKTPQTPQLLKLLLILVISQLRLNERVTLATAVRI